MRALAVLVLLAGVAAADPTAKDQAKAHFKQGKAFQDVGAFAKAAVEYKTAYDLDPRPEMLFNIAQAYRLAGDKQSAVDYFQKYLAAQPSGPGANEARIHIAELTKQLEEEAAAKAKADEERRQREQQQEQRANAAHVERPPPAIEYTRERASTPLRIAGVATAGLGVVAIGVAIKLGLDAQSDADAISGKSTDSWTTEDKQTFEKGQAANRNMIISYVVGGALVAGGGVMFYLGNRTKLTPIVTPQAAGVGVSGAF